MFLFSYFYYERVIWSLRLLLLFLCPRERLFSIRCVNLWIFFLNKNWGYFSLKFMSKDYDLLITSFFTCSARVRFGVLQLWYQSARIGLCRLSLKV